MYTFHLWMGYTVLLCLTNDECHRVVRVMCLTLECSVCDCPKQMVFRLLFLFFSVRGECIMWPDSIEYWFEFWTNRFYSAVNRGDTHHRQNNNYIHLYDTIHYLVSTLSLLAIAILLLLLAVSFFSLSLYVSFSIKLSLTVMSHCFWYTSLAIQSMQCTLEFYVIYFIGIVVSTQFTRSDYRQIL